MVTAVPDAVIQLKDSKLRIKPDKSSYLLCKYTFNGTQITKIDPVAQAASLLTSTPDNLSNSLKPTTTVSQFSALRSSESGNDGIRANDAEEVDNSADNSRNKRAKLNNGFANNSKSVIKLETTTTVASAVENESPPFGATDLLPAAMKMHIIGTLIIHIDAEKRIFKFEFIQTLVRLN